VLRVVHVDQGAQGRTLGFALLCLRIHRGGRQQRPGRVEDQGVVALDLHDVGVPGDGPERLVPSCLDPVHRVLAAQQGERLVQPVFVGVGGRIGERQPGFGHGKGHREASCSLWV
jgi:hypothetical protein